MLLNPENTLRAAEIIEGEGIDFMVHFPIPNDHIFYYMRIQGHPDFERRMIYFKEFALQYDRKAVSSLSATSIIAIGEQDQIYPKLFRMLDNVYTVLRATSPLDHKSLWMEVFSLGVNKGSGLARLCFEHNIEPSDVLAIGNDYNDLEMLQWAGSAAVVSGAPESLFKMFKSYAPVHKYGALKAIINWLEK